MNWTYQQSTGQMRSYDGALLATGYAGKVHGKNNPMEQDLKDIGPLPRGKYTIESPVDTKTHGPYAMHLTPEPANQMFGRSAFLIHGDSIVSPGEASEGCIILPRTAREAIWNSGVHELEVIA